MTPLTASFTTLSPFHDTHHVPPHHRGVLRAARTQSPIFMQTLAQPVPETHTTSDGQQHPQRPHSVGPKQLTDAAAKATLSVVQMILTNLLAMTGRCLLMNTTAGKPESFSGSRVKAKLLSDLSLMPS